jgi:hypothetical protein
VYFGPQSQVALERRILAAKIMEAQHSGAMFFLQVEKNQPISTDFNSLYKAFLMFDLFGTCLNSIWISLEYSCMFLG